MTQGAAGSLGRPAVSVVVLAAGLGSRLGRPFPKPLAPLRSGRSILQQQWDALTTVFPGSPVHIVVGFKKELIMEAFPDALFVYNPDYSETNTSKSLLRALRIAHVGGVVWLNGDVVFDQQLFQLLVPLIESDRSAVCTTTHAVGEEEVKFTVSDAGSIRELSKTVPDALGEAVGINFVAARDRPTLVRHLAACGDQDYFERGIEMAIASGEMTVWPIDVTTYGAVEVDTQDDLDAANAAFPS